MCDKDEPSIRNNGLRYAMITNNVRDVQLCILVDSICGGHMYEVSGPTMKSMQISSHFHSEMLKGYKFPAGLK
jgi:hypothetical protein